MNMIRRCCTYATRSPIQVQTPIPVPHSALTCRGFSSSFNSPRKKPNCPYVNCSLFEFQKLTRPETRRMMVDEVGVMGNVLKRDIEAKFSKMIEDKVGPVVERIRKLETLLYARSTYLQKFLLQLESRVNSEVFNFIVQLFEEYRWILSSVLAYAAVKLVEKIAELKQKLHKYRTQKAAEKEAAAAATAAAVGPEAAAAAVGSQAAAGGPRAATAAALRS